MRDRADVPAVLQQCQDCGAHVLLRPGGLCADCIAKVGLAKDQDPAPYEAWRQRVSEQVAAGGPGKRT